MDDSDHGTALREYRASLLKHKEMESKVKRLRLEIADLDREFKKTEDDLLSLQSVGQIIGEVLRQIDEERCKRPRI